MNDRIKQRPFEDWPMVLQSFWRQIIAFQTDFSAIFSDQSEIMKPQLALVAGCRQANNPNRHIECSLAARMFMLNNRK